jgi:hypothetical protein
MLRAIDIWYFSFLCQALLNIKGREKNSIYFENMFLASHNFSWQGKGDFLRQKL